MLIGQPEAITFNILTLFGLLDFQSTVWCTDELLPIQFVSFSNLFLDLDFGSFTQDVCQGASETRNMLCPSTHGALTYLQNGHSRG